MIVIYMNERIRQKDPKGPVIKVDTLKAWVEVDDTHCEVELT